MTCVSVYRNNTEYMMTVGLNLLTVALEVGADHIANYPLLLSIVKDSLCRNLLSVSVSVSFLLLLVSIDFVILEDVHLQSYSIILCVSSCRVSRLRKFKNASEISIRSKSYRSIRWNVR